MTVVNFDPTRNSDENPDEQCTTPGIRVVLADSQSIYRVGMRKVFALEDDIRVVAQAETLSNLYTALQRYPTDVVVLEGQLIAGTIDAIPELVRRAPEAKIIVQVVETDESNTVELYGEEFAASYHGRSLQTCWSSAFARSPMARLGSTTNR